MGKILSAKMAHICLNSTDMDQTLDFYSRAFADFKIVRNWIEDGMRVYVFHICEGVEIEVFERGTKEQPENIKWHHISIETKDIHGAYKHLVDCGAAEVIPPTEAVIPSEPPLPCAFAFVAGPDGEQIELNRF